MESRISTVQTAQSRSVVQCQHIVTGRLAVGHVNVGQPEVGGGRIAAKGLDYSVQLTVVEMDDKTETLQIVVTGTDLQLDSIVTAIHEMGGSLHSIDGVKVVNENDA